MVTRVIRTAKHFNNVAAILQIAMQCYRDIEQGILTCSVLKIK